MSRIETLSFRTCQVISPVTLCSAYVVILLEILNQPVYKSTGIISGAWDRFGLGSGDTFSKAFTNNIIIVAIFLLFLIVVTLVILFIFYMEWHACLNYYFYVPPFIILTILTPTYAREILISLNWFGLDLITMVLITYNFAAFGIVAIFGIGIKTPLCVQQLYLIHNSAILAILIVNALPGWAPWMLLGFLVLWDLFAVLAPFGPLNMIINMAEREGMVDMPGLVYSTDVAPKEQVASAAEEVQAGAAKDLISDTRPDNVTGETKKKTIEASMKKTVPAVKSKSDQVAERVSRESEEEDERGVRLGLGDFIFYGVLIGKASFEGDWIITLSCYASILVGLCLTMLLLTTCKRPLPALPISIGLGICAFFLSKCFAVPFSQRLNTDQIFI